MHKIKTVLPAILFLFFLTGNFQQALAQSDEETENTHWLSKDRFYLGGNFGLSFGNVTFINISPLVGYRITPRWSAGVGATYMFYKARVVDRYNQYLGDVKTSVYGGRTFMRYTIFKNLFAHTEYEILNYEYYDNSRINVPAFYAGGGYIQPLGQRGSLFIMVLYDFLYDQARSLRRNPDIRMGITMGL